MRTLRKHSLWVLVGIAVTAFTFTTGNQESASKKFQSVRGWGEKLNHKIEAVRYRVDRDELVAISARLQEKVGVHRLDKKTGAPQTQLRDVLARRRGKPIDLAHALKRIRQLADWKIQWHERNGTPVFITGAGLSQQMPKSSAPSSVSKIALSWIGSNRNIFQLEDPLNELQAVEEIRDELGKQHVKFQQWYRGVPIWGHELVVHFDANGELYAVNARYSPTPREINHNNVRVSAEQAMHIARENLSARTGIKKLGDRIKQILSYSGPTAKRYIWMDSETQKPHLVWHIRIRPNLRDHWYYFIDAGSGEILEYYNDTAFEGPTTATATDLNGVAQTIHVYEAGGTFYMIDASRPIWQNTQPDLMNDPKGALWTLDVDRKDLSNKAQLFHVTSSNNIWNDAISVSANANMGRVFEYYFNSHNRQGIDGNGSTVISVIHVTQDSLSMDNAFWNGAVMAYGDGGAAFKPLAGALDVAAHEMTHGVIQRTVNLEYKFESGALNESFADVFGVMVDRDDWKLGEDVVLLASFPSGALRDMEDPHNSGIGVNDPGWQPAHMNEFLKLNINQDNGGVHINSGIPNKACYLMGHAIGKDKTEQIYYRVLDARYLNSQSNFIDMRLAAIRAATDLFGDPSPEVDAVKAAFDGVGIVGDTGREQPQELPPVQGNEWIAVVNATATDSSLYLVKPVIQDPSTEIVQLTATQVYSSTGNPVSVSDDGSVILFVDGDNFIRAIKSDGSEETVISSDGIWNSIALSPDASKLAATTVFVDTTIYIFDLKDANASKVIRLYSPTTQEGVKADVALFADALDWDLSSRFVLYDAFNRIPQTNGAALEYWDVNILDVNNEIIFPIFPPQPEGISIGNPSFAQTDPNVFVFDYADFNQGSSQIMAVNLFTGEIGLIEDNGSSIGFPEYSIDDRRMVFQRFDDNFFVSTLRQIPVAENKIQSAGPSEEWASEGKLAAWFAIGSRPSTDVEDGSYAIPSEFSLHQNYPNPFNPETTIRYAIPTDGHVSIAIYGLKGRRVILLESGLKRAGEHFARWDGRDATGNRVASGVYFYRLEARSLAGAVTTLTKKMTILK